MSLTFNEIVFYLQILLPAYRFTVVFQITDANISQVIPGILALTNTWSKLSIKKKFKTICET